MSNDRWVWTDPAVLRAAHGEQLAEHGGGAGIRDEGLFESAVARPVNLAAYGNPDAAELAAAYAFRLARNHPFVDGNKRTAFIAAVLFLHLNGLRLVAPAPDRVMRMLDLAAGTQSEGDFAAWLREHTQRRA